MFQCSNPEFGPEANLHKCKTCPGFVGRGPAPASDAVTHADTIDGWMFREELRHLADIASGLPAPAVWVEIGCENGRSSYAVGASLPKGSTLHLIDPKPGGHFQRTLGELRAARPDLTVRHHAKTSLDAAPILNDSGDADVIFIDGDHSYEAVNLDINIWLPRVKLGGTLMGHDYGKPDLPGVTQAVDEEFGERVILIPQTSIWAVKV